MAKPIQTTQGEKVNISFRMPTALYNVLRNVSHEHKVSQQSIIVSALEKFLSDISEETGTARNDSEMHIVAVSDTASKAYSMAVDADEKAGLAQASANHAQSSADQAYSATMVLKVRAEESQGSYETLLSLMEGMQSEMEVMRFALSTVLPKPTE